MILGGMFGASQLEAQVRRLFAGGVPGFQLDLIHASNLYQDAARTTLVAANGDPIGSPTDLSGNDNHPTQGTSTSRPTFLGYASHDGADDYLVAPVIDFSSTSKITIVAAVKTASAAQQMVAELGNVASSSNAGAVGLQFASTTRYRTNLRYSGGGLDQYDFARSVSPSVLSATYDFASTVSDSKLTLREDGVAIAASSKSESSPVATTGANNAVQIGRRATSTLYLNGGLAGLTMIGRELLASELALIERYNNFLKTGLPA